jgi:hypothetical protein
MKEEKIGGHGSWFYRHQQHGDMERRQPGGVLGNQKKGRRLGEHRRQPASQPANQPSGGAPSGSSEIGAAVRGC